MSLSNGNANGVGDTLAERAGAHLDAGVVALGMAGRPAQLSERTLAHGIELTTHLESS